MTDFYSVNSGNFQKYPRQYTVIHQRVIPFWNYVGEYKVNTNQGANINGVAKYTVTPTPELRPTCNSRHYGRNPASFWSQDLSQQRQ